MYRSPAAAPPAETLHSFTVATARGREAVGCLMAIAICFAVALAVSVFAGTPRELDGWVWTFPAGMIVFGVVTFVLHARRKRTVRIVRQGEVHRLVVDGADVALDFPLDLRGTQHTVRLRGVPIYEVFMQCVAADGRAVSFHETRGAIHGPRPRWLDRGVVEGATIASFDVGGVTILGELRAAIEAVNRACERSARA